MSGIAEILALLTLSHFCAVAQPAGLSPPECERRMVACFEKTLAASVDVNVGMRRCIGQAYAGKLPP